MGKTNNYLNESCEFLDKFIMTDEFDNLDEDSQLEILDKLIKNKYPKGSLKDMRAVLRELPLEQYEALYGKGADRSWLYE